MVPVDNGVIQAHFQALSPDSVYIFPNQIPACFGVGRFEIRGLGIPQAEAVMMLGGEHHIFHSGLFGGLWPTVLGHNQWD